MMIFNLSDYLHLATLFSPDLCYAGYRPNIAEIPNGDGKVDAEKRFLHVALKYDPPEWAVRYLARAHFEACRIAERLGVPAEYYPRVENGTLRVLDYPEGAGTEEHCDFDLFTVNCWRSTPADLESKFPFNTSREYAPDWNGWDAGVPAHHIGEIGELVGLGPATPHRVPGRPYRQQAIVYFASPAMSTKLPTPYRFPATATRLAFEALTTGQWQIERSERSRVYK